MRSKEEVKEFYDNAYRAGYDNVNAQPKPDSPSLPFYWNFLTLYRPLTKNDLTLEIGCGEGKLMRTLAPHVKTTVGVDISEVAIENADRWLSDIPNVELRVGHDLSFAQDSSFDIIYEATVFQHMLKPYVREYIAESFAKLKTEGLAFFHINHDPAFDEIDEKGKENQSSWSATKFSETMVDAGFEMVAVNVHDISYLVNRSLKALYVIGRKP